MTQNPSTAVERNLDPRNVDPTMVTLPDLDRSGGNPLTWLLFAVVFTVLMGGVYPLVTALIDGAIFPAQANGSLVTGKNGAVRGSSLIGQNFSGARYFIPRPSAAGATGYDSTSFSGSNLAPSNPALRTRLEADSKAIAAREGIAPDRIPPELLAASGSGTDPHITPASAEIQVARVARARGLSVDAVRQAVARHTEGPTFGILGQSRVNVLELNLDLDGLR